MFLRVDKRLAKRLKAIVAVLPIPPEVERGKTKRSYSHCEIIHINSFAETACALCSYMISALLTLYIVVLLLYYRRYNHTRRVDADRHRRYAVAIRPRTVV